MGQGTPLSPGWALHIVQEPVHISTFSSPPSLSAAGPLHPARPRPGADPFRTTPIRTLRKRVRPNLGEYQSHASSSLYL